MKNIAFLKALTIVLFLSLGSTSEAQLGVAIGTPQFGSFGGGPFDAINLGNLNVHFAIPVLHKAGRNVPFLFDLTYDSSIWTWVTSGGTKTWQPVTAYGWKGLAEYPQAGSLQQLSTYMYTRPCNPPYDMHMVTVTYYSYFVYTDSSGTRHYFPTVTTSTGGQGCSNFQDAPPSSASGLADDGSGFTLSAYLNTGTVYSASNKAYVTGTSSTITDSNGNMLTKYSSGLFADTLGQPVLTAAGGAPSPLTFTYSAPSGPAAVTVTFISKTVQTNFGCSGISDPTITGVSLVDRITLPDQTYYQFTYENTPGFSGGQVTGRLASVSLPTGGAITYTYNYQDGHNGIICTDGSTDGLVRTTNGGVWTYTRTQDLQAQDHWTTTLTSPPDPQNAGSASNDTVIDFRKSSSSTFNFYETQRVTYQGAVSGGTVLMNSHACYNNVLTNCPNVPVAAPITKIDYYTQPPGLAASLIETTYNNRGLPTERKEFDYGSVLKVDTTYSYASLGTIYDHPSSILVTDGSANVLAKTTFSYDEYSTYPLQATSGTPQHVGVGTASRGNLTSVSTAVTWNPVTHAAGSSLIRHFKYYDTGNIYQAQDVNGQWATYSYDATAQGLSTRSCGNSFSTGITLPIAGLASSAGTTWDCAGGVITQTKDLNGSTTTISYSDAYYWRPGSIQDPSLAATAFTYTAYNPTTQASGSLDTKMLFNANTSVVEQLTTIGSYGQQLSSQQREGPASPNYDSTQTMYDLWLRPYQSTMPCVSNAGMGCPTAAKTTSTFDAIGRVTNSTDGGGGYTSSVYSQNDVKRVIGPAPSGENLKQKQLEFDGLGRLTSVCEVTALPGSGNCGQTNQMSGYWTKYAYGVSTINSLLYTTLTVTQNAQGIPQTRLYTYDLIGRLVSEQNPETNNLSIAYSYDSAVGCTGTFNGDLVKVVDAKGNVTCNQYDALHRIISTTYPSGPDSSVTPTKSFVYDNATYAGTAMSNAKGHLAEAYTGPSGSKTTDEFFSYSGRGEVTDVYEFTLHSGMYYQVTAGVWENGALKSLSSNISGLPSLTYSVDSMGRPSLVSASSGQNPVTSTSYNLSSFTQGLTFGSADSDQFTMDPNTGRRTKYVFKVGSHSDTGMTTWNPNGSLGTFTITDNIPTTVDTQTCTYTHDDLPRISGVNCKHGSTNVWNQSFTYDAFGNITKTVAAGDPGIAFQAGYSQSTNWITSLPGAPPTYDSNGRMTYDGAHTYAWDAEGKMVAVDTTTSTYDALGRMVEKNIGGTYTQIVYSPLGKTFSTMNGQSLQKAFLPLPGAQAVYTSAGLAYYRHGDHLGSSRLASTPGRTLYSSTAYAPFGEPYAQAGTSDVSFTGQEQNTAPGLNDFLFRRQSSTQGRWISPDPAGQAAIVPTNPQSWNRYSYVLNNPMSMVDPLGLYCYWTDGSGWDETGDPDTGTEDLCGGAGGQWVPDDGQFTDYYNANNGPTIDPQYSAAWSGAPPSPNPGQVTLRDNDGYVILQTCKGTINIQNCGYQFGQDIQVPKSYINGVNLLLSVYDPGGGAIFQTTSPFSWQVIYQKFGITDLIGPPAPSSFQTTPCYGQLQKVDASMIGQLGPKCSGL